MSISTRTINLDPSTIKIISQIAKELKMEEIEVIRNGLKLISLYADLKKEEGRMLIQRGKDQPAQELQIP